MHFSDTRSTWSCVLFCLKRFFYDQISGALDVSSRVSCLLKCSFLTHLSTLRTKVLLRIGKWAENSSKLEYSPTYHRWLVMHRGGRNTIRDSAAHRECTRLPAC